MKDQADPYGRGSYCIVVAMHGDKSREAKVLRRFRDKYLEGNFLGEKIIDTYYSLSPKVNRKLSRYSYGCRFISQAITALSRALNLIAV